MFTVCRWCLHMLLQRSLFPWKLMGDLRFLVLDPDRIRQGLLGEIKVPAC